MEAQKAKSVLIRFLKGMIGGAVAAMALVTFKAPTVWSDFIYIFNSLGMAAAFGAVTGLLLAAEKWASWTD